jgi:hypothetical protein
MMNKWLIGVLSGFMDRRGENCVEEGGATHGMFLFVLVMKALSN